MLCGRGQHELPFMITDEFHHDGLPFVRARFYLWLQRMWNVAALSLPICSTKCSKKWSSQYTVDVVMDKVIGRMGWRILSKASENGGVERFRPRFRYSNNRVLWSARPLKEGDTFVFLLGNDKKSRLEKSLSRLELD
jgi:hypothetical protein